MTSVLALALSLVVAAAPQPPAKPAAKAPQLPTLEAIYEHNLSTPAGVVPLTWPAISYDRQNKELFVVAEGFVRIFDASGMEVHRFGDDGSLGNITRVLPLEDGELVLLTSLNGAPAYLRCDFRGELIAPLTLTGLPEALAKFEPDQLGYYDGDLYFAERGSMRVVVTDVMGRYRDSYRLADLVAAKIAGDLERKAPSSMDGFNVDASGNILFTMSTMFAGAVLSRTGDLRIFGSRGSTPGRFNIIGDIDADEAGNVYVTDRLRSIVSVWDRELRALGEFGYRGDEPSNLLTPFEIAVGNGKVFVTQAAKRGVKVFRVRLLSPEPPPAAEPAEPQPPRAPPSRDRSKSLRG